jgi:hypothetical protein
VRKEKEKENDNKISLFNHNKVLYISFFSPSSSVVPDENPVDAPNIEEEEQQQVNDNLSEQVDAIDNENLQPSSQPENSIDDVQQASIHDVFDPRTWENLDNKGRDILIEKGLVRFCDVSA